MGGNLIWVSLENALDEKLFITKFGKPQICNPEAIHVENYAREDTNVSLICGELDALVMGHG